MSEIDKHNQQKGGGGGSGDKSNEDTKNKTKQKPHITEPNSVKAESLQHCSSPFRTHHSGLPRPDLLVLQWGIIVHAQNNNNNNNNNNNKITKQRDKAGSTYGDVFAMHENSRCSKTDRHAGIWQHVEIANVRRYMEIS